MAEFCPKCGTPRTGTFRFCRTCGLDFDALPAAPTVVPQPPAAPMTGTAHIAAPISVTSPAATPTSGTDPATYRLLAMLAWLLSALFIGWLALVQLGYAGTILDNGSLALLGGWNLVMAALMVFGVVRLHRSTRRASYRTSTIWAIVIVVIQGFQIATGATHFAYIAATVAAAGAGVLCWLAYTAMPEDAKAA
jgi:hypothetical protein